MERYNRMSIITLATLHFVALIKFRNLFELPGVYPSLSLISSVNLDKLLHFNSVEIDLGILGLGYLGQRNRTMRRSQQVLSLLRTSKRSSFPIAHRALPSNVNNLFIFDLRKERSIAFHFFWNYTNQFSAICDSKLEPKMDWIRTEI